MLIKKHARREPHVFNECIGIRAERFASAGPAELKLRQSFAREPFLRPRRFSCASNSFHDDGAFRLYCAAFP